MRKLCFEKFLYRPTEGILWNLVFEIFWILGALSVIYLIYLKWPFNNFNLDDDERIARVAICVMYLFSILVIRWAYFHRKVVRSMIMSIVFSLFSLVVDLQATDVVSIRFLGVSLLIFALLVYFIYVNRKMDFDTV